MYLIVIENLITSENRNYEVAESDDFVPWMRAAAIAFEHLEEIESAIGKTVFLNHIDQQNWQEALTTFNSGSRDTWIDVIPLPAVVRHGYVFPLEMVDQIPRLLEELMEETGVEMAQKKIDDSAFLEEQGITINEFPVEKNPEELSALTPTPSPTPSKPAAQPLYEDGIEEI